jgi:hypothetical protein
MWHVKLCPLARSRKHYARFPGVSAVLAGDGAAVALGDQPIRGITICWPASI